MNPDSRAALPVEAGTAHPVRGSDATGLIAACAVIGLAAWLDVGWVRESWLGVPGGLWAIGAAFLFLRWRATRKARAAAWGGPMAASVREDRGRAEPGPRGSAAPKSGATELRLSPPRGEHQPTLFEPVTAPPTEARPIVSLSAPAWARFAGGTAAARALSAAAAWSPWAERLASRGATGGRGPARPLRIGLDVPQAVSTAITLAPGVAPCEFTRVCAAGDPAAACRRLGLDALVASAGTGSVVFTAEHPDREAAWYDWARPRPLSYATVFPGRIDPGRVGLGPIESRADASIARVLVEAAALLARTPERLRATDAWAGRRPFEAAGRGAGGAFAGQAEILRALMQAIRDGLAIAEHAESDSFVAGARALGAWLASTDDFVPPDERRTGLELAARLLRDDPVALLRVLSGRVACGDDAGSVAAAIRADELLRSGPSAGGPDPLPYVLGEFAGDEVTPMGLGRAAAGLCLACSAAPTDQLVHLLDDLAEDLRYCPALLGRDADQFGLLHLVRAIGHGRAEAGVHARAA